PSRRRSEGRSHRARARAQRRQREPRRRQRSCGRVRRGRPRRRSARAVSGARRSRSRLGDGMVQPGALRAADAKAASSGRRVQARDGTRSDVWRSVASAGRRARRARHQRRHRRVAPRRASRARRFRPALQSRYGAGRQRHAGRRAAVPAALRPRGASRALRARHCARPRDHRTSGAARTVRGFGIRDSGFAIADWGLAGALAACCACSGQVRRAPSPIASGALRGANVLLITIDTLRADYVGAYGSTRGATPTLDRFAREGLRFDTVYAHVPLTLPSHATLLTGRYPTRTGVHDNGTFTLGEIPTLGTAVKAAGYETAAFVGAFVLDARFGLNRGFDLYDDRMVGGNTDLDIVQRRAEEVVAPAYDWIRRTENREPKAAN